MLNKKAMKVGEQVERALAADVTAIHEGQLLCAVIEDGVEKVTVKATVDGSEKIAGFAMMAYDLPSEALAMEQFTVPASGSLIFSLRNANVVAGSGLALVVGGSALTISESSFSSTPSTGTMKLDLVGGRIKFAAGDAGKVVKLLYRHQLTVAQRNLRYHEKALNNRDTVMALRQVGVAKGYLEIATDYFVSSVDFAAATSLKIADGGMVGDHTGSGAVISQGRVLALPDLTDSERGAFLKISCLIG